MVVIEVEETNNVHPPKSASADATDGFETASDAELPSDEEEQQPQQGDREDHILAPQGHSKDALNDDDELNQVRSIFPSNLSAVILNSNYCSRYYKCANFLL